jgi:hypothetical protein
MAAPGKPVRGQEHKLFVIGDGPDELTKDTFAVLKFLVTLKAPLRRMGINITVQKIESRMLTNPRLAKALKGKGITELPALATANHIYLGRSRIIELYRKAAHDIKRLKAQGTAARSSSYVAESSEDLYRNYISEDIDIKNSMKDRGETAIGESQDDIMAKYQARLQHRADANSKRRGAPSYVHDAGAGSGRLSDDSGMRNSGSEMDAIDNLIAQVSSGPVTQETLDAAHRGEGTTDAQEDMMMRAFWENQTTSM